MTPDSATPAQLACLSKLHAIPTVSFNREQKKIAERILLNTPDAELTAVYSLLTQRVKTGFVFDEAPEVNHDCVALVRENEELGICVDTPGIEHKLIIGENYDALKNLCATYINRSGEGQIDVIYIDPPYNMEASHAEGNDYKDELEAGKFIYRDKFTRDGWLNMLNERLKLARRLLSEHGVLFISIDDSEQAYLSVLCNEIFGEENFIAHCFVLDNLKGKTNANFVTSVGSKLLIYAKKKSAIEEAGFNEMENLYGQTVEEKYAKEDEFGRYNAITFKKTGQSKLREDRPLMFYPILQKGGRLHAIAQEEFNRLYNPDTKTFDDTFLAELREKYAGYEFILPRDKEGTYLRWTSGFAGFCRKMNAEVIYDGGAVYQKVRPEATELLLEYATGTPKTLMYRTEYSLGTRDFTDVMGKNIPFNYPKPVRLLKDILRLLPVENPTVLDFFAGSGTTGQAVMELNAEDGGQRRFILVTNNENDIGHRVTRERLLRVITGKGSDGKSIAWAFSKEKPCLAGNSVRVFEIEHHPLSMNELGRAEELAEQARCEFTKLNREMPYRELDIYNELAALNPLEKNN